jgi:nitrous oxidase accessory protein NosD
MVITAAPTATLAASDTVTVKGQTLTAKIVDPAGPVTGDVDATGYDIAVYFSPGKSGTVDADIHGALWYGVVADGAYVTVTGSRVHDIGDSPLNGVQRGNAIYYYDGARGTISGNQVFDFQKNGITISGKATDGVALADAKTSATVVNNVVTGEGRVDYIAQNGIQVSYGANAVVKGNIVRGFYYTPEGDEATALLAYEAGAVEVLGNRFAHSEVGIYDQESDLVTTSGNSFARNELNAFGDVKAIRNVHGSYATTTTPRGYRFHFKSEEQPANTVMGQRLHWTVKVDGRMVINLRQRFSDHDDFAPTFGTGNHHVEIYKNGHLVKTLFLKV